MDEENFRLKGDVKSYTTVRREKSALNIVSRDQKPLRVFSKTLLCLQIIIFLSINSFLWRQTTIDNKHNKNKNDNEINVLFNYSQNDKNNM